MHEIWLALTSSNTFAILGFGFLIGLKHAIEADHVAAVTAMVSERKSLWSSAGIGGVWGLGHTISLLIAGGLVLLLNFEISETTERWLEFGVGVMLALLGLNVLRKVISGGHLHFHTHEHSHDTHTHPHLHDHNEHQHTDAHQPPTRSPKALIIGMVHGIAGSAALMLAIIPTIDSKVVGMLYILVFGVGSIGGMMLMSFIVGLPFHFSATRSKRFHQTLQAAAGLFSVVLGFWIIYEKGFADAI